MRNAVRDRNETSSLTSTSTSGLLVTVIGAAFVLLAMVFDVLVLESEHLEHRIE